MKLDIDFSALEILVKNMGAMPVDWTSDVKITTVETDWKIDLETKGIDVQIEDIDIQKNKENYNKLVRKIIFILFITSIIVNIPHIEK